MFFTPSIPQEVTLQHISFFLVSIFLLFFLSSLFASCHIFSLVDFNWFFFLEIWNFATSKFSWSYWLCQKCCRFFWFSDIIYLLWSCVSIFLGKWGYLLESRFKLEYTEWSGNMYNVKRNKSEEIDSLNYLI